MDLGLTNQVAIVTGGASGIGRAISEDFGKHGAKVVLTYFESEQGATETAAAIEAAGSAAVALRADLTQDAEVDRLVSTALDQFGRVDILVANSGGLLQRSPVADCSIDPWAKALGVNLTSTFLSCRAVLPLMKQAGSGSIITISSLAAHDGGGAESAHYATAKGGVLTFTKALAKEVAPDQIRVNSIAPGLIATKFHDRFTTPEGRALVASGTPLGGEGTAQDVAGAALFLAPPLAGFITGETIEVNVGQGLF